jgi:hypothetical protein
VQSFENHFFRPRGGVLSGPDARYVSLGNGGLRAYDYRLASRTLATLNLEHAVRLRRLGPAARPLDLFVDVFGDAGVLGDGGRTAAAPRSPTRGSGSRRAARSSTATSAPG